MRASCFAALLGVVVLLGAGCGSTKPASPSTAGYRVISRQEATEIVHSQWRGSVRCNGLETFDENVQYPCTVMQGSEQLACWVPHLWDPSSLSPASQTPAVACSFIGRKPSGPRSARSVAPQV